jgi:ferritin
MNIEEAKAEIQELVDMLGSRQDREDLAIIYNFMKKQQAELEKKDKIIDLMANAINDLDIDMLCSFDNQIQVEEYFINKVEREGK